jgi:hypothetical protein
MEKIQDKFIPYDLALRLKNLGFDYVCFAIYRPEEIGVSIKYVDENFIQICNALGYTLAPLWQDALDWFREQHNLEYQIQKIVNGNYHALIHKNTDEYLDIVRELKDVCIDEVVDVYSYKEARIETLIKLIEYVEKQQTNIQE